MDVTHKTKVSLYAVAACLPFLVGAILWMSSVASDAKEAKSKVDELQPLLLEVRERVIRIEEHVTRRK